MRNDVIYPELSYALTGLCMQLQEKLGRYCKEKQYADALEIMLQATKLNYQREPTLHFELSGETVKGNRADFIIENKILIELKTVPYVTKKDYYQTMRYLKAANLKLALLINFRSQYLKPKRILNSSYQFS